MPQIELKCRRRLALRSNGHTATAAAAGALKGGGGEWSVSRELAGCRVKGLQRPVAVVPAKN